MENWKPIKNYEDYYEVSDLGRIRRKDSYVRTGIKHSEYRLAKGTILKQNLKRNGYLTVDLSKYQKVHTTSVHRIVAEAFIPNSNNLPVVNHKNFNKQDNRAENLEWCTYEYNSQFSSKAGRMESKQKNPLKCLELNQVFGSSYEAAEFVNNLLFHNSKQVVNMASKIRCASTGKQPRAYGFHWAKINIEGSTTSSDERKGKCPEMESRS